MSEGTQSQPSDTRNPRELHNHVSHASDSRALRLVRAFAHNMKHAWLHGPPPRPWIVSVALASTALCLLALESYLHQNVTPHPMAWFLIWILSSQLLVFVVTSVCSSVMTHAGRDLRPSVANSPDAQSFEKEAFSYATFTLGMFIAFPLGLMAVLNPPLDHTLSWLSTMTNGNAAAAYAVMDDPITPRIGIAFACGMGVISGLFATWYDAMRLHPSSWLRRIRQVALPSIFKTVGLFLCCTCVVGLMYTAPHVWHEQIESMALNPRWYVRVVPHVLPWLLHPLAVCVVVGCFVRWHRQVVRRTMSWRRTDAQAVTNTHA